MGSQTGVWLVILMGVSIGGAVAIDLAAKDGARGLVVANTFTSLPDAAGHSWPWLPMKMVLATRMDSLSKIKDYRGPLLVSHAEADEVVPLAQGQALYDAAPGPKKFFTVKGGSFGLQIGGQAVDLVIDPPRRLVHDLP